MRSGLLAIGTLVLLAACDGPPFVESKKLPASALEAEYARDRVKIHGEIDRLLEAGDSASALAMGRRYLSVGDAELKAFIVKGREQERADRERALLAKVKAAKPSDHLTLLLYYSELEKLDPSNGDYPKQWQRHRHAQDQAEERSRRERERVDRAQRRKQGVSVGMSKADVLMSNWGRPKRINSTTTIRGTREQWVYDGGYLYFDETGTLTAIQN